mmetsp:Transcript_13474/g.22107  ORF Transcript_13474/g.22107 Transcript_13474/m.22107 type:complete len:347 (-) Transcript_13474:1891-2931(-)
MFHQCRSAIARVNLGSLSHSAARISIRRFADSGQCYAVISEGDNAVPPPKVAERFRIALMRHVDPSLAAEALRLDTHGTGAAVDLGVATQHHDELLQTLSTKCNLEIVHLASDGFPDSVFIEDTLVVVGDVALLTRPGASSRQGEVDGVRRALTSSSPESSRIFAGLQVRELEQGTLDGGDVLFTGKEFFVGISHRTDVAGIQSLAKAFPSFRVTAVDITHSSFTNDSSSDEEVAKSTLDQTVPLHLKSMCSRGGEDTLLMGGRAGSIMSKVVESVAPSTYKLLQLPDMAAANCVWANDVLVRPLASEMSKESSQLLESLGGKQVQVATSELAKLDGAITCCSVLM